MSLQHAAKYLANQGRGKDTMLVHMTPREVGSLQALAKAQGGSLSINPDTGLPEAGFLDSMLPMLLGAGITAATGGAAAPWMLGLGVGGLQTLRTGDIGKGITAGLGAYGGAGLAGGLMGAATAAQTPTAQALQSNIDPSALEGMSAQQVAATGDVAQRAAMTGEGIGALGEKAGRAGFMGAVGGGSGLAKAGLAAASPLLMDSGDSGMPQPQGSGPNPYRYRFERGEANPFPELSQTGIERSYFPNARYVQYAGGGSVEAMSDANAVGANTGFPMADIQRGAYATPYQQPISQNVVTGASDTRVDPYTGTERLAGGGMAEQNPLLGSPYGVARQPQQRQEAGGGPSPAPSENIGSPTGSIVGDIGFALSGMPGLAGAIANAAMSANSSISPSSINATNGSDVGFSMSGGAPSASVSDGPAPGMGTGLGSDGGTGDSASAPSDGGAPGEANGGLLRRKYATGGLSDLGGYSDGGRLLRGPGDGVSDSIPAVIGKRQPARLADGEFVVPARIVSELGNGSTEAGARKLYAMLDRVQKARGKTTGKGKVAKNTRADKYLPA